MTKTPRTDALQEATDLHTDGHGPFPKQTFMALCRELELSLSEGTSKQVRSFANAILHGDEQHRAWLADAAERFIAGNAMPAPPVKPEPEDGVTDEDAADVGRAFLRMLPKTCSWGECPTEYVTRLTDERDEHRTYAELVVKAVEQHNEGCKAVCDENRKRGYCADYLNRGRARCPECDMENVVTLPPRTESEIGHTNNEAPVAGGDAAGRGQSELRALAAGNTVVDNGGCESRSLTTSTVPVSGNLASMQLTGHAIGNTEPGNADLIGTLNGIAAELESEDRIPLADRLRLAARRLTVLSQNSSRKCELCGSWAGDGYCAQCKRTVLAERPSEVKP